MLDLAGSPQPKVHLILTCLLSAWLVGCSETGSSDSAARFAVVDSAGVEIVHNAETRPADSLEVFEDLRVGEIDSDDSALIFSDINAMLVDEEDRIFVGNNQTATVRVFDDEGTFLREFGGRGEGPSEIPAMLNDMKWAGDQVAVIDWQRGGKTLLFDTTGAFAHSIRNTLPDGQRIMFAGYTPKGWVSVDTDATRPEDPNPGQAYPRGQRVRRVTQELDSLGEVLFELPPRVLYGSAETHGLDWPLFDPVIGTGVDAEGRFYRSAGSDYRIDVWDADGNHVRSIRKEYNPIPLTEGDVEAYKDRVIAQYDTMSRLSEAQRQQQMERYLARINSQADFPRPQSRPPLGTLLVARNGAIWVERQDFREPAEWWGLRMTGLFDSPEVRTSWDIFSSDGRFVGNVILPPRFEPMAVSDQYVVGVRQHDFDVEYVTRYRIVDEPPP